MKANFALAGLATSLAACLVFAGTATADPRGNSQYNQSGHHGNHDRDRDRDRDHRQNSGHHGGDRDWNRDHRDTHGDHHNRNGRDRDNRHFGQNNHHGNQHSGQRGYNQYGYGQRGYQGSYGYGSQSQYPRSYGQYGYNTGYGNRGYSNNNQYRGGNGALVLFEHDNFRGYSVPVNGAISSLTQLGMNDRVSSIVVNSGVWEVCVDGQFRGRCYIVDQTTPGLHGLNDQISSIRPVNGYGGRRY